MGASPPELSQLEAMKNLARAVAGGECIWFIGAGFSREGEMPSVYDLTWAVLNNTFRHQRGPWDLTARLAIWERLKRLLISLRYENISPLGYQSTAAGIEQELQRLQAALDQPEVPVWADRLLNLGRVTDVLQRAAPDSRDAFVVLARLMGFEPEPESGSSPLWDKPPLYTHHLLALLIREGRIATLITTNYDELIEKACGEVKAPIRVIARESDLEEFPAGPPTYLKIHGCRGWYLRAWRSRDAEEIRKACESLIVTDRQLQHWRGEDWSREKVKSTLREFPFFFIGYSASDVVLQTTLNMIADELQPRAMDRLFMAPELSFPFFQFCTITAPEYDPLNPPNVIGAYGKPLMMTLYPMVMGRYFGQEAQGAGAPRWAKELKDAGGDNPQHLHAAYQAAQRLLAEWAEATGCNLVRSADPNRLNRSPFSAMVDALGLAEEGYIPLADRRAEYRELVQSFARMLAFNFPTAKTLGRVKGRRSNEGPILDLHGGGKAIRVAVIPSRIEARPTHKVLTWLRAFLERQSHRGITGTFAFLVGEGLDQEQRIWEQVSHYGNSFNLQIWNATGSFISPDRRHA